MLISLAICLNLILYSCNRTLLIDETEGALSSSLLMVPVFRHLFIIKTTESDYLNQIQKLESKTGLTPVVEIQIELSTPRSGLIDEIKSLLEKKGMELLSYMPIYQTGEEKTQRSEKIFDLSPVELFQEFYATKYPESKEMPDDLMNDFMKLLEKVKHASHSS